MTRSSFSQRERNVSFLIFSLSHISFSKRTTIQMWHFLLGDVQRRNWVASSTHLYISDIGRTDSHEDDGEVLATTNITLHSCHYRLTACQLITASVSGIKPTNGRSKAHPRVVLFSRSTSPLIYRPNSGLRRGCGHPALAFFIILVLACLISFSSAFLFISPSMQSNN